MTTETKKTHKDLFEEKLDEIKACFLQVKKDISQDEGELSKWKNILNIGMSYFQAVKEDEDKRQKILNLLCKLMNRETTNSCHQILNRMNAILLGTNPPEDDEIYWAKKLYDILRYEFKEGSNESQDISILDNPAFDFQNMFNGIMYENYSKRYMTLIVGLTQSGKTFLTIAIAMLHLMLGHLPIVVVKDTNNKTQFVNRYRLKCMEIQGCTSLEFKESYFQRCRKVCEGLRLAGAPTNLVERFDECLYCDSESSQMEQELYKKNIDAAANGSRLRLLVVIKHFQHMERITNTMITAAGNGVRSILMVDEAHILGAYRKTALKKEHAAERYVIDENITKYDEQMVIAKSFAYKVVLITATFLDVCTSEQCLYPKGVVFACSRQDYRGFEECDFRILCENDDEYVIGEGKDSYSLSKQKLKILAEITKMGPKERIRTKNLKPGIKGIDKVPHIVLDVTESVNKNQNAILNSFKHDTLVVSEDHQTIIDGNPVCITQNQFGPHLFCHSLRGQTIKIGKTTLKDDLGIGEFVFPKSIEIHEILQWLAINGGADKYPVIIIIAYKSAEEGMTFSTSYNSDPMLDFNWHVTEMIVFFGKATPASRAVQRAGRMTGNHGDNIRPIIYCTEKDKKKILRGYTLGLQVLEEIYSAARKTGDDISVMEVMQNIKIFKNRIPRNCFMTTKYQNSIFLKQEDNPDAEKEENVMRIAKRGDVCMAFIGISRYTHDGKEWKEGEVLKKKIEEKIQRKLNDIEKQTRVSSGSGWRKINKDKLSPSDKIIYNKIVKLFEDEKTGLGLGRAFSKMDIVKQIYPENDKLKNNKASQLWHWHSDKSKIWTVAEDTDNGLLFGLEKNKWYVRYN
jgi:hypothetical protein